MATLIESSVNPRCHELRQLIDQAGVNLVVLGFPKCGTTAFAEWLDGSAHVAVSHPKETFQLCPEFAVNLRRSEQVDLTSSFATRDTTWRAEATTLNVYSSSLRQTLAELPTKVILLVRDPVESVLSWHNQMFQAGTAVSEDFFEAWEYGLSLNEDTLEGVEFLRAYALICQYGLWASRWRDAVGADRLLMVYDHEVRGERDYLSRRVDAFLGTSLQLPAEIPVRNQFSAVRFPRAYALLRRPGVKRVLRQSARYLPVVDKVRRYVRERILLRPTRKVGSPNTTQYLAERFQADQKLLASLYRESAQRWPAHAGYC